MKKSITLILVGLLLLTVYSSQAVSEKSLPVVGNQWNLERLIKQSQKAPIYYRNSMNAEAVQESAVPQADGRSDYSQTNVQVAGIDESDIVKTDGTYIYQVREYTEVIISQAYPADSMKILSRISVPDTTLLEMYVDGDMLVILGQKLNNSRHDYYNPGSLVAVQYDISDKSKPHEVRRIETEGSYVSSRKIGSYVYIVTNKWLYDYALREAGVVVCKDTVDGELSQHVTGLDEIRYFPDSRHENYIILTAFDASKIDKAPTSETFLGSGYNVYMSKENLYVAAEEWSMRAMDWNNGSSKTKIHKFAIDGLKITYQNSGEVHGSIINQFSMDEYDGHFRIATTVRNKEMSSEVYVLNKNMSIVGKIENIAPREQIYSARFVGKKGYLVTFEIVDPLFVLDLSDHRNPKILGELKIPGFSNYLHPLDENTLLGLGRDTEIVENPWGIGFRQKGMKLAIFDVSDMANPKEKFSVTIGDSSVYSEALHNHKAIMFRDDIMAFPLASYMYKAGQREYAGAVVYRVSQENGFTQLGSISHGELQDYSAHIKRMVSIKEYLYTISDSFIQAHQLDGMQKAGTLKLQR